MFGNFPNSARAKSDLRQAITDRHVWNALAMSDIRSKYRMSTFGSLWITLATGTLALSIGLIYGQFFGQDIRSYLPYFTASYVTWIFIASVMGEASTALISSGNLIKSSQMPIVFHVLRMVQRNLIVLAHNAIVVVLVWPFIRWSVGPSALLALAGLLLLYAFLIGASIVLSIICVRYRDVPPLVQVMTQFLFFVTPIIWQPEQLKFGGAVLALNPITYMLIIVRDPLLGRPVAMETWAVAIVLTAASLTAGSLMYLRFRNRVAYWV